LLSSVLEVFIDFSNIDHHVFSSILPNGGVSNYFSSFIAWAGTFSSMLDRSGKNYFLLFKCMEEFRKNSYYFFLKCLVALMSPLGSGFSSVGKFLTHCPRPPLI
jgi:hypothetical protein